MENLLALALLHLAALAMPGPDYLLVSRYALLNGRGIATLASLGIALGIMAHVIISLTGLTVVLAQWPAALWLIRILGALYLIYLGVQCLFQKVRSQCTDRTTVLTNTPVATGRAPAPLTPQASPSENTTTYWAALGAGFMTNLLNPKAILFFASLLTAFIPEHNRVVFGFWAAAQFFLLTLGWFALVAYVLSHPIIQQRAQRFQGTLESVTGIAFLFLGCTVLVTPFAGL